MILVGLGVLCLLIGLGVLLRGRLLLKNNVRFLKKQPENPEFAVLIPARFESSVIEGLFKSLTEQTVKVKPENVYVIVESKKDPTVKLAKEHGYCVVVRKKLTGRERKGYALDEAIRSILAKRSYDLYFIFDADNTLAPDYIECMLESYAAGFEIVTGYRNIKNHRPNAVAAASILVFSLLNTLSNHCRIKSNANVVFSGTGCFVDGKLVDKWQGWPFHSLTEDYELSLYAIVEQLATFYNERAVFYDEQPITLRQTFDQRVRWIRGYFDARKIYLPKMREKLLEAKIKPEKVDNCTDVLIQSYSKKSCFGGLKREILGVSSIIWLVVGVFLIVLGILAMCFYTQSLGTMLLILFGVLLAFYLILVVLTIVLLRCEKLNIPRRTKVAVIFYNPFYLVTFVPCALKAFFARKVDWKKIDHQENA